MALYVLIFMAAVFFPLATIMLYKKYEGKKHLSRYIPLILAAALTVTTGFLAYTSDGWDALAYISLVAISGIAVFTSGLTNIVISIIQHRKNKSTS